VSPFHTISTPAAAERRGIGAARAIGVTVSIDRDPAVARDEGENATLININ